MPVNMQVPLTSCIGREQEIATACELLGRGEVRLLTLSGTGGVGKTRLALEVVRRAESYFRDGSISLSLETLRTSDEFLPTLCQQFAIPLADQQQCSEALKMTLQGQDMLLFLDNFEQIVDAAPLLTDLLSACPQLTLLVTSRISLQVRGEHELLIAPLSLPNEHIHYTPQSLVQVPAIQLFVQRVRAFQPDFSLHATDAHAISEICRRLDGLPLALELAAARLRLFSPQTLLQRLERCLPLLTNGTQDQPVRQRTLRATLSWSYDLLTNEEQRFFRGLAIFRGGFTLEMAEQICEAGEATVDLLCSLLRSHLLQRREEDEGPRLLLLETICQFANELLSGNSLEKQQMARAHANCYLSLAEVAAPALEGVQRERWQHRLDQEQANLRVAWDWLVEQNEVELVLRLSAALRRYWMVSGAWRYEREYQNLQHILQQSKCNARIASHTRARALMTAGMLASYHHTYDLAIDYCEESFQLCRECGERQDTATALNLLGKVARVQGRRDIALKLLYEGLAFARAVSDQQASAEALLLLADVVSSQFQTNEALPLISESLTLFKTIQDRRGYAAALNMQAYILEDRGERERAWLLVNESLELYRAIGGNSWEHGNALLEVARFALVRQDYVMAYQRAEEGLTLVQQTLHRASYAWALCLMGHAQLHQGDEAAALTLLQESELCYRSLSDSKGIALLLSTLARHSFDQGDYATAQTRAVECLHVFIARNSLRAIPPQLELLGKIALTRRAYRQATFLLAATTQALQKARLADTQPYAQEQETIQAALGIQTFQSCWQAGYSMTPEQALGTYLAYEQTRNVEQTGDTQRTTPLTVREQEILGHLSRGLTNPQIARQLVISPVTVNAHVRSIYNKLAVNSRSEATRYAVEHHLA